ncbi:hypothetical protein F4678DRAFT_465421 [Xylaria arbuscula]|nr:hypothetical protein F4678DRAFT_465421 [Xylaria arbuscula]
MSSKSGYYPTISSYCVRLGADESTSPIPHGIREMFQVTATETVQDKAGRRPTTSNNAKASQDLSTRKRRLFLIGAAILFGTFLTGTTVTFASLIKVVRGKGRVPGDAIVVYQPT